MSGDSLGVAAAVIRRLNIGRATVPAGGPTDRVMRDAVAVIKELDAAAARLRSLAAMFEQPPNRDQEHTFTGHALAEMLRGEG